LRRPSPRPTQWRRRRRRRKDAVAAVAAVVQKRGGNTAHTAKKSPRRKPGPGTLWRKIFGNYRMTQEDLKFVLSYSAIFFIAMLLPIPFVPVLASAVFASIFVRTEHKITKKILLLFISIFIICAPLAFISLYHSLGFLVFSSVFFFIFYMVYIAQMYLKSRSDTKENNIQKD
jgi:hypothetical protein